MSWSASPSRDRALALIGRPADADGRRLLEEHPREVGHAVRRSDPGKGTFREATKFLVELTDSSIPSFSAWRWREHIVLLCDKNGPVLKVIVA
jgi:hypothetical protein